MTPFRPESRGRVLCDCAMQTRRFSYRSILEVLDRHAVEHIVIGGKCAVAHGAPITTFELTSLHMP